MPPKEGPHCSDEDTEALISQLDFDKRKAQELERAIADVVQARKAQADNLLQPRFQAALDRMEAVYGKYHGGDK